MTRALVLNAGASWAAYQVGALRHVIGERNVTFDLYAGTGIGAMNAALVACGAFEALEQFWDGIGVRRLVTVNTRTPWLGPGSNAPQRQFVSAHVDEERLAERGVMLVIGTLNLQTGQEEVLTYPGGELPLIDALMATVATPGISPPVRHRGQQLVEGTLVNGFLMREMLRRPIDEIIAIAATLGPEAPTRRFRTWRAVMERALAMNQAHDVRDGLAEAEAVAAAAASFRSISQTLPERLAGRVGNPLLQNELREKVAAIYESSDFPLRRAAGPTVVAITPTRTLSYPLWRFDRGQLQAARSLGYEDARRILPDGMMP